MPGWFSFAERAARRTTSRGPVSFLDDVLAGLGALDRAGGPLGSATIRQY